MPDFNTAPKQPELIPVGTLLVVQMMIRPGGFGEGKMFKNSASTGAVMLDCEFVVTTKGQYEKRKLYQNFVFDGVTEGHSKAAEISRRHFRAMLESARNIRPDDNTDEAIKARNADYEDFQNLRFLAKIGIERSKDGGYDDKNVIIAVVTPASKQSAAYVPIEQVPKQPALPGLPAVAAKPATAAVSANIGRPAWVNSKKDDNGGKPEKPEAAE